MLAKSVRPLLISTLVGVVACGLTLSPLGAGDDAGTSSSSGSNSTNNDPPSTSSSGGSIPDASPVDAGTSSGSVGVDASLPEAGPSSLCDGQPTPNYPANGKCYWLSAPAEEDQQARACADSTDAGAGETFVPKTGSELQIPGALSKQINNERLWMDAKFFSPGLLGTTGWQWRNNTIHYFLLEGSRMGGEDCLTARYVQTLVYTGTAYSAAKCDKAKHRVVCQSQ